MEPMQTPLHPQVPALLKALGLRVVDVIQWDVLACAPESETANEPTVILKFGTDERKAAGIEYESRILGEVLPTVDQSMFERLVVPEFMNAGVQDGIRWMSTRYIKGDQLARKWSELAFKPDTLGGKGIAAGTAKLAVDVLRDLRGVDVSAMPKFVRRFDFPAWLATFKERAAELVAKGLAEETTMEMAFQIFSGMSPERFSGIMFTNGDFYPRNFIMLDGGKIAVADWVGGLDPWEFVAMHAWLLMWGNPAWQVEYLAEIKKHFPVDTDAMQAGMLVRSFDLAYRWRAMPEVSIGFARTQMLAYFHQAVDKGYVRQLFA